MAYLISVLVCAFAVAFGPGGQPAGPATPGPKTELPSKPAVPAEPAEACGQGANLKDLDLTVDGVKRHALVYVPASASKGETPVVFAFHGHGGNARSAARSFGYHTLWPEAISVYMEGLPTTGKNDPKGEKNGWQQASTDNDGRDLKFFDAVLAKLRKDYKVDERRIYCTGHSNGGAFTYALWAARGETFAAVAPSASGSREVAALKAKPALHLAGELDETVPFANQRRMMERARTINGCQDEGKPWAKSGTLTGTEYPSKAGSSFVSVIYPGTHKFPAEAPALIVKFFKEHAKPAVGGGEAKPDGGAKVPAGTDS